MLLQKEGGNMNVLITGGSGTFGRAFIRRVITDGASRAVAYARHEVEIAAMNAEFGKFPAYRGFVGDVRDLDRLEMAMRGIDVVVHAAALKRIEICEADPIEAIATNIGGTVNTIKAALRSKVKKAVLLSTDKAVSPVNLYGSTKLAAERLFLAANNISGGACKFSVVRYGNIWGSRGSVIHQWRAAKSQEDAFITDPEATRYFMTIDDAVNLVLDTVADIPLINGPSSILLTTTGIDVNGIVVPRQLKAYRLADLAFVFWGTLGWDMKKIDLPLWEKRHETLDGITDSSQAPRMTTAELKAAIRGIK
jgi:FlaA1/EpsC-like NDP-sugar epimerase